jgi:dTDP-glucose pyrophosphorylase
VIQIDGITEGAASTVLKARELIDDDTPLLIANSDQFVEWNSSKFIYESMSKGVDGSVLTFTSSHPKWSFAKLDEHGFISEIAEKKPISDIATVGIYFWRNGSDFVKYADQMIAKDIRVNNEFYVFNSFLLY